MEEIRKPKDILLATLSSPNATVMDLLKNDITADNTGLMSIEQYKAIPFIQQQFTNDKGVFDDSVFTMAYAKAAQKFVDLTDDKAYKNLGDALEYSSTSIYKPLGAKKKDEGAQLGKLRNPEQRAYGRIGINVIEEPEKTPEELAQTNKYWDNATGAWSKESVEEMSLSSKAFGRTLVYAKYAEDTLDELTGQMHKKGQWKLDEDGSYYAETLDGNQLLDKQVVNFQDILTKEDSWINKIDFYDSDGYEKSVTGVAFKTLSAITPYLIPGVNKVYGAITAGVGLASTLPMLYKSIEGLLTGKADSAMSESATKFENFFYKFEASKSHAGREGFWNLESFGDLVSSTMGQLYQQRAAASLSNYIKPDSFIKALDPVTQVAAIKAKNNLAKGLSLGYMALTQAGEVYNEALKAGYDERTAGLTSMLSGGALYSVMNFNSGLNGFGTWFLDKTTGYNPAVERGAIKKIAKEFYGMFDDAFAAGDKKGLASLATQFKKRVVNLKDGLLGATESVWTNALIEGAEEVSEEVIQDSIKGMIDTLSWMGYTAKEGSFGGWDNVFSKEGLARYTSTFVGGAVGGALFDMQDKYIEPLFDKDKRIQREDRNIVSLILSGQSQELQKEIKRYGKSLNTHVAAFQTEVDGKPTPVAANGKSQSQADLVVQEALKHVSFIEGIVGSYVNDYRNIGKNFDFSKIHKEYKASGFEDLIKQKFAGLVADLQQSSANLRNFGKPVEVKKDKKSKDGKEEVAATEAVVGKDSAAYDAELAKNISLREQLAKFNSGENYFNYTLQFQLYSDPNLRKALSNLDKASYSYHVHALEYHKLPDTSEDASKITKASVDAEYAQYQANLTDDALITTLETLADVYMKIQAKVSPLVNEAVSGQNQNLYLHELEADLDNPDSKSKHHFHYIEEAQKLFPLEEGETAEEYNARLLSIMAAERNMVLEADMDEAQQLQYHLQRQQLSRVRSNALLAAMKSPSAKFSFSDRLNVDFAKELHAKKIIEFSDKLSDEQKEVVNLFINKTFADSGVTNWSSETIKNLLAEVITSLNTDPTTIYARRFKELRKDDTEEVHDGVIGIETKAPHFGVREGNLFKHKDALFTMKGVKILDSIKRLKKYTPELKQSLENMFDLQSLLNNAIAGTGSELHLMNFIKKFENVSDFFEFNEIFTAFDQDDTGLSAEEYAKKHLKDDMAKYIPVFLEADSQETPDGQPSLEGNAYNSDLYIINEALDNSQYREYRKVMASSEAIARNPLVDALKTIYVQLNDSQDGMNFIDFLAKQELDINDITDIQEFFLEDGAEEQIATIGKSLDVLRSVLHGMSSRLAVTPNQKMQLVLPSINSQMSRYLELYGDKLSIKADQFKTISDEDARKIDNFVVGYYRKLEVLSDLHSTNRSDKFASENTTKNLYMHNLSHMYDRGIKIGEFVLLPENTLSTYIKEGGELDEYIMHYERVMFGKLSILTETEKKALIDQLIEIYPGAIETSHDVNIVNKAGEINQKFFVNRIVSLMTLDPADFLDALITAVGDMNIIFKLEQELSLRDSYSRINTKGFQPSTYLTKQLFVKLKEGAEAGDYIHYSDGTDINTLDGASGSGKTAVHIAVENRMYKNLYPDAEIILTAPTKKKSIELNKTVLGKDTDISKVTSLYGESDTFALIFKDSESLADLHEQSIKALSNLTPAEGDTEGRVVLKSGGIEVTMVVRYDPGNQSIQTVEFEGLPEVAKLINDDVDKKLVFASDESTLLDYFSIALIAIAAKKYHVTLVGDKVQKGFHVMVNGVAHSLNVNKYYTNAVTSLSGVFRANNKAVSDNAEALRRVAMTIHTGHTNIIYNEDTEDALKIAFGGTVLDYEVREGVAGEHILKGHQLAEEGDTYGITLKLMAENSTNLNKNIAILMPKDTPLAKVPTEVDNALQYKVQQQLLDAGARLENIEFYVEDSQDFAIQGEEADYVILYNLPALAIPTPVEEKKKLNLDVDTASIYTYATRAKDFTLIFEEESTGLFRNVNMNYRYKHGVKDSTVSFEFMASVKKEQLARFKSLLEKFPPTKVVNPEKKSDSEEDTEDTDEGDTEEELTDEEKAAKEAEDEARKAKEREAKEKEKGEKLTPEEIIEIDKATEEALKKETEVKKKKKVVKDKKIVEEVTTEDGETLPEEVDATTVEEDTTSETRSEFLKFMDDNPDAMTFYSYYTRLGLKLDESGNFNVDPNRTDDLHGFAQFVNDMIPKTSRSAKTSYTSAEVLKLFKTFRMKMLAGGPTAFENSNFEFLGYQLVKKPYNAEEDHLFNKENNDASKTQETGFMITLEAQYRYNVGGKKAATPKVFTVTLGHILKHGKDPSGKHAKLPAIFENTRHEDTLIISLGSELDMKALKDFKNRVKAVNKLTKDIPYKGVPFLVPVSAPNYFKISDQFDNDDISIGVLGRASEVKAGGLFKAPGVSVSQFEELGWSLSAEVKVFEKSEWDAFEAFYNRHRVAPLSDNGKAALKRAFYNRAWFVATPTGVAEGAPFSVPVMGIRLRPNYLTYDGTDRKLNLKQLLNDLQTVFQPEEKDKLRAYANLEWSAGTWAADPTKIASMAANPAEGKKGFWAVLDSLKASIKENTTLGNTQKAAIIAYIDLYADYAKASSLVTDGRKLKIAKERRTALLEAHRAVVDALASSKQLDNFQWIYEKKPNKATFTLTLEQRNKVMLQAVFEPPRFLFDLRHILPKGKLDAKIGDSTGGTEATGEDLTKKPDTEKKQVLTETGTTKSVVEDAGEDYKAKLMELLTNGTELTEEELLFSESAKINKNDVSTIVKEALDTAKLPHKKAKIQAKLDAVLARQTNLISVTDAAEETTNEC